MTRHTIHSAREHCRFVTVPPSLETHTPSARSVFHVVDTREARVETKTEREREREREQEVEKTVHLTYSAKKKKAFIRHNGEPRPSTGELPWHLLEGYPRCARAHVGVVPFPPSPSPSPWAETIARDETTSCPVSPSLSALYDVAS